MALKPETIIYTDGSCKRNPGPGGWAAIVITDEGKTIKEHCGYETKTTNNRMELMAVIKGLEALRGLHLVTVLSDSKYVTDAFNKNWINSWKSLGWERKDGELQNADLWKTLDRLVQKHTCKFEWVRGHANNKYNERADKLAVKESHIADKELSSAAPEPIPADIATDDATDDAGHSFADVDCEEIYEEGDFETALHCLDAVIKNHNLAEFGTKMPCGNHEWCGYCGTEKAYECAYAYMKHQKDKENI